MQIADICCRPIVGGRETEYIYHEVGEEGGESVEADITR